MAPGTGRIGAADFSAFNDMLASLLGSGMPLTEAIRAAATGVRSPSARTVLEGVQRKIEGGGDFARTLEENLAHFPPGYAAIVRSGIESGDLAKALRIAVRSCRHAHRARRELARVLVYPAIVLALLAGFTMLMLFVTIPAFQGFIEEIGAESGLSGRGWIWALNAYAGAILCLAIALLAAVLSALLGGSGVVRAVPLPAFLRGLVPFLGSWMEKWASGIFLRELAALLGSGVSLAPALRLCAASFDAGPVREEVSRAADGVERGESPGDAFGRSAFLPGSLRLVLKSRSDPAELGARIEECAATCEEDMRAYETVMYRGFEVLVVAVLGAVVAGALVSLWSVYLLVPMSVIGGL